MLRMDGEHIDWSRADNDGSYSVVLPGPGRYVVVCSADGWKPESDVMEFVDVQAERRLHLSARLTLSGTLTSAGQPLVDGLVLVTRQSGETVASVHSGDAGRYEMTLPPSGRYVLTAVNSAAAQTFSRAILVGSASLALDVDLLPEAADAVEASSSR